MQMLKNFEEFLLALFSSGEVVFASLLLGSLGGAEEDLLLRLGVFGDLEFIVKVESFILYSILEVRSGISLFKF